jgi:hypothetical protein
MTERSRRLQGVLAGVGVFLVDIWPVLIIWRAGSSGSVGDLSEIRFLGIGVALSLVLAIAVGWLMAATLRRAASSPELGTLDPWGAYALGVGVFTLALTAVPALIYALLLADENQSLRSREWLIYLLWIGGHVVAVLLAAASSRALLGRELRQAT